MNDRAHINVAGLVDEKVDWMAGAIIQSNIGILFCDAPALRRFGAV
jgi:hypothetical protein